MDYSRPIVEEMSDVSKYTPNLFANFKAAMDGKNVVKETSSVKSVAKNRLRYNSPDDRLAMSKYIEMKKYIKDLERLKKIQPQSKIIVNRILMKIRNQSRQETPLTLSRFDPVLEHARNFQNYGMLNYVEKYLFPLDVPPTNDTFRITFQTILDVFFFFDIKLPFEYILNRLQESEKFEKIPHVLQGEIAALDQNFKISLDTIRIYKSIRLICILEDDTLPDVPPIYIDIPDKYPFCSPTCVMMHHDYLVTPFLSSIKDCFSSLIPKFPEIYSVTYLLNCWAASIQKACGFEKCSQRPYLQSVHDLLNDNSIQL